MPPELPPPIRHRLDRTLDQWRQWRCRPALRRRPELLGRLDSGLSNYSVLVQAGARLVVRIDGPRVIDNGLNRQAEWRALQDAHAAGLAPAPRYFNPELGALVCDYLPPDPPREQSLQEIAALLRAIHALPPRHQRLDLRARLQRYESQLAQCAPRRARQLAPRGARIRDLLGELDTAAAALVPCHNDLLAANRLYSGARLYALDWEYSAMAEPLYDLAVTAHGDDLDAAGSLALLRAYLGRRETTQERARLQRCGCVYRFLEILWYAAAGASEAQLTPRLARLDALLQAGPG